MVVEIRRESRAAVLVHREQTVLVPAVLLQEIRGALRRLGKLRARERACGCGESADRQTVPAREDLLVARRPDPRVAYGEQDRARTIEQRRDVVLAAPGARGDVGDR